MIENVLSKYNISKRAELTIKSAICTAVIALAVILPQIAHLAVGEQAGIKLLPMYLPVLLGGCVLGTKWGLAIGLLSPIASYIITSITAAPMPTLIRLPFMMAELAVFAAVAGSFSNKITEHKLLIFPSVILAQLCGRATFLISVTVFQRFLPFTASDALNQIKSGFAGIALQIIIVPIAVLIINALSGKRNSDD